MTVDSRAPSMAGQPLATAIPARLRALRKDRRFTLKDVAIRIGTSPQTVQRLETGGMTISLEWVDRFISALELQPEELFNDSAVHSRLAFSAIAADLAAMKVYCEALSDAIDMMLRMHNPGGLPHDHNSAGTPRAEDESDRSA